MPKHAHVNMHYHPQSLYTVTVFSMSSNRFISGLDQQIFTQIPVDFNDICLSKDSVKIVQGSQDLAHVVKHVPATEFYPNTAQ